MNSTYRHATRVTETISRPVPDGGRFARPNGRPQRAQPLMRRIEAVSLAPDLSVSFAQHMVPQTALFEQAVSGIARGTLLTTRLGPIAIEDLQPGDILETSEGLQPVLWIGSTMMRSGGGDSALMTGLTRVLGDAFGVARPASDALFGPSAELLHNPPQLRSPNGAGHVLTPLCDFIDGHGVIRVTPPGPVQVFHIALRRHAVMEAGGLQIGSFHPGAGKIEAMGQNAQTLFLSLFPHIARPRDFGPVAFPQIAQDVLDGRPAA